MTTQDTVGDGASGGRLGREGMPGIPEIAAHWQQQDPLWLVSAVIGWGEPFCFGCGWLPPVTVWGSAGSFLDRAHLQDHCVAGDVSAGNLVMLCHLCHEAMPEFTERAAALEWVQRVPRRSDAWQMYTDALAGRGLLRRANRGSTMVRHKADLLVMLAEDLGCGAISAQAYAQVARSFEKNAAGHEAE